MAEASKVNLIIVLFFLFTILIANVSDAQKAVDSAVRVYVIRLKPNQDLRTELLEFIRANELKGAFIMTCVGSLKKATIRLANSNEVKVFDEFLEIVSLVGLLSSVGGHHLHISISDKNGTTYGGHVFGEMIVYTTAEIVIGEAVDLTFKRELDETYGYNELVVYERSRHK